MHGVALDAFGGKLVVQPNGKEYIGGLCLSLGSKGLVRLVRRW